MKPRELPSVEVLREYFNYDPETGELTRAKQTGPRFNKGCKATVLNKAGYLQVGLHNKIYLAHRLIWKLHTGEEPSIIDHINNDPTDNRICNLRNVTLSDNQHNRPLQHNNTSGARGIHWSEKLQKWVAKINVNRQQIYLGAYLTFDEAVNARLDKENELAILITHRE